MWRAIAAQQRPRPRRSRQLRLPRRRARAGGRARGRGDAAPADSYEELMKLKGLLDAGVLTPGRVRRREAEDPRFLTYPVALDAGHAPITAEGSPMAIGPVQLLVVSFDEPQFTGEIVDGAPATP